VLRIAPNLNNLDVPRFTGLVVLDRDEIRHHINDYVRAISRLLKKSLRARRGV
jgi:hypothetical protein